MKEIAKNKYQKFVFKHPLEPSKYSDQRIQFTGERDFNSDFSVIMISVMEPMLMEEFPHKHDFDMYLTFVGFNPNGFNDLGAEIELYLGEEQEKYVITTPTSVYIPKGMTHCPLRFVRVDRPLLMLHATLASKYQK
jgi:hypothetical protein